MTWLADSTLEHLRQVADWPELECPRYTVLERIGRGGMGSVYRVHDHELDRQAAMKVLHDAPASQETAARMLREARIIARMEHPGIVPVHDVGRLRDGRLYYVMKQVRGRRLDELVREAAPLTDRLRILQRLCETVAFAHAQGVIHRDLKPQNVMVGEFGEVLVLDWGVAKLLPVTGANDTPAGAGGDAAADAAHPKAGQRLKQAPRPLSEEDQLRDFRTSPGAVVGTAEYMSPEQAAGRVEAVDVRSDVYGLGGVLFFLLTGESPRAGTAAGDDNASRGADVSPRRRAPELPRSLDAICRKALEHDPTVRYASATALLEDVERFINGHRVLAHHESVVERVERFVWKYRTAILLVAAYLVMRAAFAGYELWRLKERAAMLNGSSEPAAAQRSLQGEQHE